MWTLLGLENVGVFWDGFWDMFLLLNSSYNYNLIYCGLFSLLLIFRFCLGWGILYKLSSKICTDTVDYDASLILFIRF